jgi:hypothetical protein
MCPPIQKPGQTLHIPDAKHVKIDISLVKCPPYEPLHFSYTNRPLHISYTKSQKLRPYTNVHHIKTLHFSYANMSKLRPYTNVHHAHHYTFLMQITKFASITSQMSTISITTLSFPSQASTTSITTHFLYKINKIASITHFLVKCPPYQCIALFLCKITKIASTAFKRLHFSYANASKLRPCPPCRSLRFFYAKSPKLRPYRSPRATVHHLTFLMKVYPFFRR